MSKTLYELVEGMANTVASMGAKIDEMTKTIEKLKAEEKQSTKDFYGEFLGDCVGKIDGFHIGINSEELHLLESRDGKPIDSYFLTVHDGLESPYYLRGFNISLVRENEEPSMRWKIVDYTTEEGIYQILVPEDLEG